MGLKEGAVSVWAEESEKADLQRRKGIMNIEKVQLRLKEGSYVYAYTAHWTVGNRKGSGIRVSVGSDKNEALREAWRAGTKRGHELLEKHGGEDTDRMRFEIADFRKVDAYDVYMKGRTLAILVRENVKIGYAITEANVEIEGDELVRLADDGADIFYLVTNYKELKGNERKRKDR